MLCKIDKFLNSLYRYSGYIASFFLILILVFIVTGIASRIFGFYIRGLTEYSGYSLATASFLALAYTFNENGHIRITLFLEKAKGGLLKFLTIWSLAISTFFSGCFFILVKIVTFFVALDTLLSDSRKRQDRQQRSGSRLKVVRWSEVEESELRVPVLL